MIESAPKIKEIMGQIIHDQMRRVAGDYVAVRERARANAIMESETICWRNDILMLSSKTTFPVKRVDVDSRVFESQIHLWEEPREVDSSDVQLLQRQKLRDIDDLCSIGSVFVFYKNNDLDECITGNIFCRRYRDWGYIQPDDVIVIYAPSDYPSGDVDELEVPFQHYLKMNAFLNSPYAFTEPRNPKKTRQKLRKQIRKQKQIKIVVLRKTPRRPENELTLHQKFASQFFPEMTEADENKARRALSVRFKVTSHWRNQWYPSENTHKRIWISDYEKGPDGAPFQALIRVIKAVR